MKKATERFMEIIDETTSLLQKKQPTLAMIQTGIVSILEALKELPEMFEVEYTGQDKEEMIKMAKVMIDDICSSQKGPPPRDRPIIARFQNYVYPGMCIWCDCKGMWCFSNLVFTIFENIPKMQNLYICGKDPVEWWEVPGR